MAKGKIYLNIDECSIDDRDCLHYQSSYLQQQLYLKLYVGNASVTDMGLVPLLEALPRQRSLKDLGLHGHCHILANL